MDVHTGLGFAAIAGACPVPAGNVPSGADVVGCALANARCEAERAVASGFPRAFELLDELFDVDGAEAFPCVEDPDDVVE